MVIHKLNIFLLLLSFLKSKPLFLNLTFHSEINISKLTETSFFNGLLFSQLIINTKIGTPNQILPLKIKLKYSTLSIVSILSKFNSGLKKFNHKNSITYYSDNFKNEIYTNYDEFIKGIKSKDNIEFDNNIKLDNFNFFLTTETFYDISGIFGLNLIDDRYLENYSLIKQLKERNLISKLIFYFDFDKLENSPLNFKGNLIIGSYPHEINPKKYNKENFFTINVNPNLEALNELYEFTSLKIYYGDNEKNDLSDTIKIPIDFTRNLILGSKKFLDIITNEINKFYKDKCKSNELRGIISFSCDKDININLLKDLNFHSMENNFTFILNPSDLFMLYNDRYYYLVHFLKYSNDNSWSLGISFLRKFNLVFDQDKKVLGYYKLNEKTFNENLFLKILLIIALIIIIILIILLIYYKTLKQIRKIRANELETNIEYIPYEKSN